ncbi:MAG: UvrD-helicase domain-containing protein [Syntrophales bacterium]
MQFRIADTFIDSLAKLPDQEQKAVKTTAFDLQVNPANPGMQYHKLDKARDQNFWSVRVSRDMRLIVHRTDTSLLLCYVGHHDNAYHWAERRKLETHPVTGAAQLVEIRETVREITVPKYVDVVGTPALNKPLLFADMTAEKLLGYGVPAEWLADVRNADEDTLLEIADHLPGEAAEALLNLATGATPQAIPAMAVSSGPFEHPDAQRRFRVMNNVAELERAMEYPWEKWTIFLHPAQRHLVERDFNGPARISGSAGTGKTIVALHRAVSLARSNPGARVLLTTFSDTLANALTTKLRRLINNEPRLGERLEVYAMNEIGLRLYELNCGRSQIAPRPLIEQLLSEAAGEVAGHKFSSHFLMAEWEEVVDAWQLDSWETYRDAKRLGRKTRLPEKQRIMLWSIFALMQNSLKARHLLTYATLFSRLASHLAQNNKLHFDFTIVDEAQDISIPQLRFLAALGAGRPNSLFFTGDLGQRIFQQPFSWKALGVDIRGRSRTLRINYRTSHQIRKLADRLLAPELSDVDGNVEERRGVVSIFNGPKPAIMVFDTREEESAAVGKWLSERRDEGVMPHEIGLFVRSLAELDRGRAAVEGAGLHLKVLDEKVETVGGHVSISTMHLAKGLEFRAVVVMACDDEVIPLQERIELVVDDTDLEEVFNTERHLLYVVCTRARDHLLVTGVDPASEFLDDLRMAEANS